jgi:PAS domain S-box-containing protein
MAGLRSPVRSRKRSARWSPLPDYQLLFEKLPSSCMVLDVGLRILAINDSMLRDTMTRRDDVVGRTLFEMFPANPEDSGATGPRAVRESLDEVRHSRATESIAVHRYDLAAPDGGYLVRYWSTVIEPVLGPEGELLAILLTAQNVTDYVQFREQHQAQGELWTQQMAAEILLRSAEVDEASQEVRLSARRIERFLEAAPDAMLGIDGSGMIMVVNQQAERAFGYDREELIGQPVEMLIPGALRSRHVAYRAGYLDDPQTREMATGLEPRARCKDGTLFPVSVSLATVNEDEGQLVIAAVRDITERKRADAALVERTRELEISNRDLLQFASVASHDLQEPLRKVSSFCQLLARRYQGQLDEEADEYIGFVVDGAARMQALINDLLALARVGRSGDQMTDVDCGKVMRQVRRDMATVLEDVGAELVVVGDLPVVRAHQGLITQLVVNLVGNSVKFHGPRPPRVEVSASREEGEWRFAVKDNGIGIESQYASRVFDVFERLHTRSEYPGTGIGLALCRKIVELHRGRIWFESQPGAGTTFYWTIPTGGQQP